jgi:RNA polymerase sigma factor (TIGR02999 family)
MQGVHGECGVPDTVPPSSSHRRALRTTLFVSADVGEARPGTTSSRFPVVAPADHGGVVEHELETLIRRADQADRDAADKLFALLYDELHRLAEHHLRSGGAALTLGPTTLLHEAYLNVSGRSSLAFADQSRFLAYASRAMRGLLINYVHRRRAQKRGRQFEITLAGDEPPPADMLQQAEELERLGDALGELTDLEPALTELVDLHFFCGFSFGEIAAMRRISERTVQRDWRKARLLLQHVLLADGETAPDDAG